MKRLDLALAGGLAAALGLALASAAPARAQKLRVIERPQITLEIQRIDTPPPEGSDGPSHRLVLTDTERGEVGFDVGWPDAATRVGVRLEGRWEPGAGGGAGSVVLAAELTLADGSQVRAERRLELGERTTFFLFEVYREEDRPLTLAIEATPSVKTSYSVTPPVGRPVRLRLEIQRLDGERAVSLETDVLNTFVGQAVSYYFRLGSAPDSDSASVRLTPLRVVGEIVEIEAELSGKLPSGEEVLVLGRREVLVTSRGSTSTLDFEAGDPPMGYRFLVTPDL